MDKHCVHCGKLPLMSDKNRRACELVADGLSYEKVGVAIGLSRQGVRNLMCGLFKKLGIRNRAQMIDYWRCDLFQEGLRSMGLA